MIKILCVKCHVSLRPEKNGTTVIEMAEGGLPGLYPYSVWDADTYKCPVCGVEIVTGYGTEPIRDDSHAPDFQEWLERYKKAADRVEYDNNPY